MFLALEETSRHGGTLRDLLETPAIAMTVRPSYLLYNWRLGGNFEMESGRHKTAKLDDLAMFDLVLSVDGANMCSERCGAV